MGDSARLLRFVIPGGLLEAPLILWLAIDGWIFGWMPDVDVLGAAAVAGGLSIPLGFLASNVYSGLVWRDRVRRQNDPANAKWFGWVDEPRLALAWGDPRLTGPNLAVPQAAWLDAFWHSSLENAGLAMTLSRGRSLLDLSNGLASSMAALAISGAVLFIATLTIVGLACLQWTCGSAEWASDLPTAASLMRRAFAPFALMLGCYTYIRLLAGSQRRVATTAELFIETAVSEARQIIDARGIDA